MEVGVRSSPLWTGFSRFWLAYVDWETGQALAAQGEKWREGILLYRMDADTMSLLRYPEIARRYCPETQQVGASWLQWKVWERRVTGGDRWVAAMVARHYEQWREYFAERTPPTGRPEGTVMGEADLRLFFDALSRRLGAVPPETLERVVAVMRSSAGPSALVEDLVMSLGMRVRQLPWAYGEPLVGSGGTRMALYRALRQSLLDTDRGRATGWENRPPWLLSR